MCFWRNSCFFYSGIGLILLCFPCRTSYILASLWMKMIWLERRPMFYWLKTRLSVRFYYWIRLLICLSGASQFPLNCVNEVGKFYQFQFQFQVVNVKIFGRRVGLRIEWSDSSACRGRCVVFLGKALNSHSDSLRLGSSNVGGVTYDVTYDGLAWHN